MVMRIYLTEHMESKKFKSMTELFIFAYSFVAIKKSENYTNSMTVRLWGKVTKNGAENKYFASQISLKLCIFFRMAID